MASESRAQGEELVIPLVATLALHALLAFGLIVGGRFADREPQKPDPDDEVDIEPPKKKVEPLPLPERLPELPKVTLPELPKVVPPTKPLPATRLSQAPANPSPPPETKATTEPTAGDEGVPDQGDPIVLPDVFVNGEVEVGHGTRPGTGGAGGTGPGNKPAGEGGTAPPPPVSIAAIKKRAMPIGDVDYVSTRDYPEEARKRGLGGPVKIRLMVDAQGKVVTRTLVQKRGHGLDELAMALAAKLRFEPAMDASDRKVASIVVWTFDFVPPE